jgi:hypothetical protein
MQVNGNLVSPARVLANAEVVEIITYNVSIIKLTPYVCYLIIWIDKFDVTGQ